MTTRQPSGHKPDSPSLVTKARWKEIQKELPTILEEIGPTIPNHLAHLPKDAPPEIVIAHLARDGAVIIDEAVSGETCDKVIADMKPYMEDWAWDDNKGGNALYPDFLGKRTIRVGALPVRSKNSWELMAAPVIMDTMQGVIGNQLMQYEKPIGKLSDPHPWQLHVSQMIAVGPGEPEQMIHRDRGTWRWAEPLFELGLMPEVTCIWALNEFTKENGATNVIPGSHKYDKEEFNHKDLETQFADRWAFAEMKKGSVCLMTGGVTHRAGRNATEDRTRVGLVLGYNLAWLRQEENQYLACPPDVAKELPRSIQKLIGYERKGYSLGYVDDLKDPEEVFDENRPRNWAGKAFKPEEAKNWELPAVAASKL